MFLGSWWPSVCSMWLVSWSAASACWSLCRSASSPRCTRMKIFSDGKLLKPASARNCFLVNQFATPGLGSLMGGRIIEGIGQLILAFLGAALFLYWLFKTMQQEYDLPDIEVPISYGKWGLAGACFFFAS